MSSIIGTVNAIGGATVGAMGSMGWFVPMLVAAVAYFQYEELMDPESKLVDIPSSSFLDEYDFIIIGAGSAGKMASQFLKTSLLTPPLIEFQEQSWQTGLLKWRIGTCWFWRRAEMRQRYLTCP